MRIHTNLKRQDLYAALPDGVDAYITEKGSRRRTHLAPWLEDATVTA